MKKVMVFITVTAAVLGVLAWIAAGPQNFDERLSPGASSGPAAHRNARTSPRAGSDAGRSTPAFPTHEQTDSVETSTPASVPAEVAATQTGALIEDPNAQPRPIIIPVAGVGHSAVHDMFNEVRGNRRHEAIDILAPRGTPVIAADDGSVKKLFTSVPGGLTVYEFDPDSRFCYYYAHLDGYAPGLHEGQLVRRGDVLGYVGTTGNAPKDTPHLHFALIRLDADHRWWKGTYVNPYPLLR